MEFELPQKAQLQQAFADHIRRLCRERVKVLCYIGIVLVPLFGLLDHVLVASSLFHFFLALRLGTAACLLTALFALHRPFGERRPSLIGILTAVVVGGCISLMTRYLGGYDSPYYAGLNLVLLSISLIAPFSVKESSITCGVVYGTYLLPAILLDTIERWQIFVSNNFFLLGTISIAITGSYISQRLRFREFSSKYEVTLTNEKLKRLDEERSLLFSNLGDLISLSLDSETILRSVLKLIEENFRFGRAGCLRINRDRQTFEKPIAGAGAGDFKKRLEEFCSSLKDPSLVASFIDLSQPVVLAPGFAYPGPQSGRVMLEKLGTRSLGVLPLKEGGQTSWLLLADYGNSTEKVPEDHFQSLSKLSQPVSAALEKARVFESEKRRTAQLLVVHQIARTISSKLDIEQLFESIYQQISQLIPSEYFLIALRRGSDRCLESHFEVMEGKRRIKASSFSAGTLEWHIVEQRKPLLIKSDFRTAHEAIIGKSPPAQAESWLGVPLTLGSDTLGVIVLQNFQHGRPYDDDDLFFLTTIADQAAGAISNARLYSQAQERATRLSVVNEVAREASLHLDTDRLFETINAQFKRIVGFVKSSMSIYYPESDVFSLVNVYAEGIPATFYKGMQVPASGTVMKIACETKKPYYSRSPEQFQHCHSNTLAKQGIQSAICIPIIADNVCIGTLNFGSPQKDGFAEGQIDLLVTVAHNLGTALKNAHLYSSLQQSYIELSDAQEQLVKSEKLRALGEMAAGVAHDFNNILCAILGRAQLLRQRVEQDPDILSQLEVIEKAAIDGAATVRRLQNFTRQRTDQVFKPVNLVEIINDTLSLTRTRWENAAQKQGVHYSVSTEFDPAEHVAGEESELREVFTNIVLNALDAMPGGGSLHIHVGSRDDQVFASITDTGYGMTKEVQEKIFDPFFTTKGKAGNGLGMSVTYGIIARHKGQIGVQSEIGKGSTITVIMPANADLSGQEAPSTGASPPPRKKGRFLIIDDEAQIRDMLAEMLSAQGHEVFTASGGQQGLQVFKDQLPDLVVTDLGMPGVSGLDVANAVKAANSRIPVILMTGWGMTLAEEEVRKNGVDFIISKPFQLPEMERILNQILVPQPVGADPKRRFHRH